MGSHAPVFQGTTRGGGKEALSSVRKGLGKGALGGGHGIDSETLCREMGGRVIWSHCAPRICRQNSNLCIFPPREPIAITRLVKGLNVPKMPQNFGSLGNPTPADTALPQGAGISRLGPASVFFIVPPPPTHPRLSKSLGLSFFHSWPGEAEATDRSPEGVQRGEREGSEAAWHGPRPSFGGRGRTRQRHCAPAALLAGWVDAASQPFHLQFSFRRLCLPALLLSRVSQLLGLSAPGSLALCLTHLSRPWTPLSLPTFHLVPGSLPGFFSASLTTQPPQLSLSGSCTISV